MGRPPRISSETWEKVRTLYDQGMNDCNIARALGISTVTVWGWRQKNHLESQVKNKYQADIASPLGDEKTHFTQALSPRQCDEMRSFMRVCVLAADLAHQQGEKIRLGRILRQWNKRGGDFFG